MDVFASLSGRLDEQLKKWNAIKKDDLPKVTELIKQADLPALIIKEKKSELVTRRRKFNSSPFPYALSTLYLPGPMKERHTRTMTASIGIIIE